MDRSVRGTRQVPSARSALQHAARFLLERQGPDGLWRDFETPAGEASLWPTAFIGAVLQSAAIDSNAIERAATALVARQNDDGGWGYNETVPTDADSTAWALLFLARANRYDNSCGPARACLLRHQRADNGGVATYADARPIRRYMGVGWWIPFWGWRRPNTEVTATAARALSAHRPDKQREEVDSAWRFVRSRQKPTGEWSPYWWTSPHYATAQAVEFAVARGEWDVVDRAVAWTQRTHETFAESSFAMAMSLSILVSAGVDSATIDRTAGCLMAMQCVDGAWPLAPIMRIPVPPDTDPNGDGRWRIVRFGAGIDVTDQHGLFTCAACVAALARYEASRAG